MPTVHATGPAERFADALLNLGFSSYEARCYVGLLAPEPQTGYAVAKRTGVPQPKVYEALRKLVARGAARQLPGEPVRFAAVNPTQLLKELEASFGGRLGEARAASDSLSDAFEAAEQEPVARLGGSIDVIAAAEVALNHAVRRVYLSATAAELTALRTAVSAAANRGVDVVVLAFGKMSFRARGVRVFRHASTDGALYRHHQSRHIALVADSKQTVFGLAPEGTDWSGVATDSPPIIAAVKGYIRHDLDLQQVFSDFRAELLDAYGPGLQRLESYRADRATAGDAAASDGAVSEASAATG